LIGSRLANFEIQRHVGHGGMADVYQGVDVNLHRRVAIKVFDVKGRSDSSQVNRFIQEARMMANWRHENIVQIFYAGDKARLFYYVMEFIDGYDLASILAVYEEKGQLMPIDDVLRIGDSVASALDYAHNKGVIHRDVKPANVMIANDDGRVVLGDFGLALDLSDKSQGEVFGSPHYIAPEQARRSSDAVSQSDLYSLGVILYEMVTGATPFNDPSPASLALQHITETPPPPRSINPSISEQVELVLLKSLEKSPEDRYQSGKELMNALQKAFAANPLKIMPDFASLPPIPINAPMIRRSDMSLNSFTHHKDVISALEKKKTTLYPQENELQPGSKTAKSGRFGSMVLIMVFVLAFLSFVIFRPEFSGEWFTMQAGPVETVTQTEPGIQFPATRTNLPDPAVIPASLSHTAPVSTLPTATVSMTQAIIVSLDPTNTSTLIPTVITGTSTPQQAGHLMRAYYNENSFFMIDKGNASRSVSGFVFERIDEDSVIQQRFAGWQWGKYFDVIQPGRCVNLLIHQASNPYLQPSECRNRVLSTLVFRLNSNQLFWIPNYPGEFFRVLWLGEEVARCEVDAGVCEFYIP
jgi:serine/threonine protein kinase